jgi:tetratricopeptide (TPR) repeat protein
VASSSSFSSTLRVVAVLAFAFWGLLGASSATAETVVSRTAEHDGFGRIVFVWPAPVSYDAAIDGGVLRVTFARPPTVSLDAVRRTLSSYVSATRVSPDGRTLEFTLAGNFSLRTFTSEKSVVIDLLAAQPAAAGGMPGGPTVSVKTGDHPGYSRIVFDWPQAVGYEVSFDDGRATVRFDRAATIDLAALNAAPPRNVRSGHAEVSGKQTVVTLAVPSASEVRHFLAGKKVVLDVMTSEPVPAAAAATPTSRPADATPAEQAKVESAPPPTPDAAAPAPPAVAETPVQPVPTTAAIADSGTPPAAATDAVAARVDPQASPPPPVSLLSPDMAPEPDRTPRPVRAKSLGSTAAQLSLGPPPIGIAVLTAKNRTLVSFNVGKKLAGAAFTRGRYLWVVMPERYSVDLDAVRATESLAYESVDEIPHPRATVLRFKLRDGFGATFHRRGAQWMAQFSSRPEPPAAIEVATLDGESPNPRVHLTLSGVTEEIELRDPDDDAKLIVVPVTAAGAGVVAQQRFPGFDLLATAQGIAVRPTGAGVQVRTGPVGVEISATAPPEQMPVAQAPAAPGTATDSAAPAPYEVSRAATPVEDAPNAAETTAAPPPAPELPEDTKAAATAETVPVVPPTPPSVEPSQAGPAVAAATPDGPEPGMLAVAEPIATQVAERPDKATGHSGPPIMLFDLAGWRRGGEKSFFANRRELQFAAANVQERGRQRARLELARFLFAHGYFAEVRGVLSRLIDDAPKAAGIAEVRAMSGITELMLGWTREAAELLNDPALNGYDDVALWRGVLAARLGDMESALGYFVRASSLWLELAPYLRSEIGLMAAEAAIEANDVSAATTYLDAILVSHPSESAKERARYLRGRVFYAAGNTEEARKQWDRADNSADRLARAGTMFYRTLMDLENGGITTRDAIVTLEKLRFAWRGDEFELKLLQQLAEMYISEKEYQKGLEAMKQAVTHFAQHPSAPRLAARMSELFTGIFTSGSVDEMSPRKALTLYRRYRELTPIGAVGDKVIETLADRLVAVDLLDRAGELLEHQVSYRLRGIEKARVGTRLAVIRLMDEKPDSALSAIEDSAVTGIPKDLARQRRHIKARALAELGKNDDALKLLARDETVDAELLRADIYWRAARWKKAASSTALVLKQTKTEKPLDQFASDEILRFGVALALAHDRLGLQRARKRYLGVLEGDDNYEAFEVITNYADHKRLTFRELPAAVAHVAGFEAFLTSYRDRVRKGSLSAIN